MWSNSPTCIYRKCNSVACGRDFTMDRGVCPYLGISLWVVRGVSTLRHFTITLMGNLSRVVKQFSVGRTYSLVGSGRGSQWMTCKRRQIGWVDVRSKMRCDMYGTLNQTEGWTLSWCVIGVDFFPLTTRLRWLVIQHPHGTKNIKILSWSGLTWATFEMH